MRYKHSFSLSLYKDCTVTKIKKSIYSFFAAIIFLVEKGIIKFTLEIRFFPNICKPLKVNTGTYMKSNLYNFESNGF